MKPIRLVALLPAALLAACAGRTPTTEINHPLDARARIEDHAMRLSDAVARYRAAKGATLPSTLRELALTLGVDGRPCFTENLKDFWYHPYAYAPMNAAAGSFQLASAGRDGQFGTGDDLTVTTGPGEPGVRSYGYTFHPGE